MRKFWIPTIFAIALLGMVVACLAVVAAVDLTTRETTLFGLVLTVFSVIASWIVSHLYYVAANLRDLESAKQSFQENLRTYARQAAEKVNTLSSQLNELARYMQIELDYDRYANADENLAAKCERMESAIQFTNLLKAVNDNALSDWEGVIGDELAEQREQKERLEERLDDVSSKVDTLVQSRANDPRHLLEMDRLDYVLRDLEAMKRAVGAPVISRRKVREPKKSVSQQCPDCSVGLEYRQRPELKSVKTVECTKCGSRWVSQFNGNDFALTRRARVAEAVECPTCKARATVLLDTLPQMSTAAICRGCKARFRVTRSVEGTVMVAVNEKPRSSQTRDIEIDDGFLNEVKSRLPQQPWPTGIHKLVAEQLNTSNDSVTQAMQELIRRGDFKQQTEGQVLD